LEPTPDDIGLVAEAAAGQPVALHADPRWRQSDLRLGLAGAEDASRRARSAVAGPARRRLGELPLQQRADLLFRSSGGALTMDRYELRRLDYSLTEDHQALQTAYRDFFKTHCSIETVRAAEESGFDKSLWERLCGMGATTMA